MEKPFSSDSTGKNEFPRGKHHNETATKKTVSLYLNKKLIERARNHNINLSRITENALNNILSQIEPQNYQNNHFLNECSFPKKIHWCGRRDLNPSSRLGKPTS
jgi:hypothetical protein